MTGSDNLLFLLRGKLSKTVTSNLIRASMTVCPKCKGVFPKVEQLIVSAVSRKSSAS